MSLVNDVIALLRPQRSFRIRSPLVRPCEHVDQVLAMLVDEGSDWAAAQVVQPPADGRQFGFRRPVCRANRDGSVDWIQPGDAGQPELSWHDRACPGPRAEEHEHYVRLTVTNTAPSPLPIRRLSSPKRSSSWQMTVSQCW